MDHFQHKAKDYEKNQRRVENVNRIANGMLEHIAFEKQMNIVDFGSGTGLLLERIAPHVNSITAIDTSRAMNEQLRAKLDTINCEVQIIEKDLVTHQLENTYDGLISSMTMHHVENIENMFKRFYELIKPGGFIAIADLEQEDGSFHSDGTTGVHHHGFQLDELTQRVTETGFKTVKTSIVSTINKHGNEYAVFLLSATR